MHEHTITYYDISYFTETKDSASTESLPLYNPAMPCDPNPASFNENPLHLTEIRRMGAEGWELINVAPLLRGCYHEGAHYGYSLTAGYYLFWKRKVT